MEEAPACGLVAMGGGEHRVFAALAVKIMEEEEMRLGQVRRKGAWSWGIGIPPFLVNN